MLGLQKHKKLSLLFLFFGLALLLLIWGGVAVASLSLSSDDAQARSILILSGVGGTFLTFGGTGLLLWQIAKQGMIELRLLDHEKELILARHRLVRSNEEFKNFARVLAHDLQEPLRSIISYSQILKMRYKGKIDEDADEFINFLTGGAASMKAKLTDLLDYTTIDQNAHEAQQTSLDEVLRDVEKYFADEIVCADGKIEAAPLPDVAANRKHMIMLFEHLLANAIEYRDESRPLRVRVSAMIGKPGFVEIVFSDNGIGIERQYFERIFALFQRLHHGGSHAGTGVGLAICKKIVEYWGGEMALRSTLGQGSEFCFTLPLARPREVKKA